ncbi:AP2-associated protein kinase 1 isoform X2 [Abrus precatorius]|uniref:non-specific serine/threonine protein kinase n=1 Tax=Abrus precatorius TaxID=3816 RepID=A0A8B8K9F1_ABRPR|nr:AP2-associated protein kinase 1 isoform X2 [Abrus precatorius]
MWRFKPFMHKEQTGLEGRTIDVGNLKINVVKAIAEGGFSCVYLARDAVHMSKQYALKHMICNDEESLALVKKEISVMKLLVGHPNVVTLHSHTIFDMGRTKEAFIVMDFCEKSLVNVLESRGAGYFDEKQVLLIFRDVCNAVFAMHCQSPPIAHRDLKAENLLLGSDGSWKLCDFGSTSTNHKRFEKPEEMGIEEDNIRKYTTPAYRAPEMWDLFLREVINEKVDIWALGCLLFRICYFKSAFDGESKLQVLNGNYRIPDLPKYNSSVTDLIRDMLQARPDDRPDITQVWFRVNEQLPINLQKSLPDRPPESPSSNEGVSMSNNKTHPVPRRNPPPPPSSGEPKSTPQPSHSSRGAGSGGQLGAFWSTQHAKDSLGTEGKSKPIFDEEPSSHHISLKHDRIRPDNEQLPKNANINKVVNTQTHTVKSSAQGKFHNPDTVPSKDFEINFFQDKDPAGQRRMPTMENTSNFQDQAFNTFVAEFDTAKLNSGLGNKSEREEELEAEVEKLKEQLEEANLEKAEITAKYEKLSAICRSQRQELQELKQALAARTPSPNREKLRTSPVVTSSASDKTEWKTPSSEPKSWQAFPEEPQPQKSLSAENTSKSVRSRNGQQNKQPAQLATDFDTWGFGTDSFSAVRAGSPQMPRPSEGAKSQVFGEAKAFESKSSSQPAGWAGF